MRYFVASALLLSLAACGGGNTTTAPAETPPTGESCLEHADCPSGVACVLGVCGRADFNAPMDVSGIDASQWFTYSDGTCVFDDDCGPWMCGDNFVCVLPRTAGRVMPPRRDFRFWDTSCSVNTDCGSSWVCSNGWCTDPIYASNAYGSETGYEDDYDYDDGSCLSDLDCGYEEDCVNPGVCEYGAGDQVMTFADIDATNWYTNYGSCSADTDCGPHACWQGTCTPQEETNRARPLRREILYYDGSCSQNTDCGPWKCVSGWCRDPEYL